VIYRSSPDEELSQGDIIRSVRVLIDVNGAESHEPLYGLSNIIVMSRNCEISKRSANVPSTNSVLVARVVRLSAAPQNLRGDIKRNRVESIHYLPEQDDLMEECFIDWRSFQPIDKMNLYKLREQNYKCTLEKTYFQDCMEDFFLFLTKPDPAEVAQSQITVTDTTVDDTKQN
jgi:hypothetical protein